MTEKTPAQKLLEALQENANAQVLESAVREHILPEEPIGFVTTTDYIYILLMLSIDFDLDITTFDREQAREIIRESVPSGNIDDVLTHLISIGVLVDAQPNNSGEEPKEANQISSLKFFDINLMRILSEVLESMDE